VLGAHTHPATNTILFSFKKNQIEIFGGNSTTRPASHATRLATKRH